MSDALPVRNLLANATGTVWIAGLQIVVIPLYLHLLGPSAYGLIAFYASLQAFLLILDLGMSTSVNREIARMTVHQERRADIPHLLHRMENVYWLGASLLATALLFCASTLAGHWFRSSQLDHATIESSLLWMSIAIALQFPLALYIGVLLGLERHTVLNVLLIGGSTIRLAAVLPVIVTFPTITAFFKWQVLATAIQTCAFGLVAHRAAGRRVPMEARATFEVIGKFALPMTIISILASGATQLDRLVVSRVVPLERFAVYALGATLASGLLALSLPINMSIFPRMAQLHSSGDSKAIHEVYAWALRLAAVVVAPAAAVLALFPREVLFAWTRDADVAASGAPVLRFLAIGAAAAALMQVPYSLQLAHGVTRLPLIQNAIYILIGVPLFSFTASSSVRACAMAVAALQLGTLLAVFPITSSRLKVEARLADWLALIAVLSGGVLPPLILRLVLPPAPTPWTSAAHVVIAAVAALSTASAIALALSRWSVPGPARQTNTSQHVD